MLFKIKNQFKLAIKNFSFVKYRLGSQNVLDPAEEPSSFLTLVYILALGFIALLALVSHLIIVQMTHAQGEMSEVAYIASRQRVVAQQIALYATSYAKDQKAESKSRLENAYFSFKIAHDYLVYGEKNDGLDQVAKSKGRIKLSPELTHIYFEQPINLHRQSQDYIAKAEAFIAQDISFNAGLKRMVVLKDDLMSAATGRLIQGLDMAAQQYQVESLKEIARLVNMQTLVFVIMIFTLLLEALLIFKPLVLHVKEYSQQLLNFALKDGLTDLSNRRAFMQSAEAEISRAKRHNSSLCAVLSDVDKFKLINDTYGHAAGDQILQHLASILRDTFRREDMVGRIGGEEFAFILPETTAEQGAFLMEKLRLKIEQTSCIVEDDKGHPVEVNYTLSFGLACFINKGENIDDLLKFADGALYEAKEGGRNRVVISTGDGNTTLKSIQT